LLKRLAYLPSQLGLARRLANSDAPATLMEKPNISSAAPEKCTSLIDCGRTSQSSVRPSTPAA